MAHDGCVKSCRSKTFGTIFKMSTSGHETVVHRFTDVPDGAASGNSSGGCWQYDLRYDVQWRYETWGWRDDLQRKFEGLTILHSLERISAQIQPGLEGLTFDESSKALYGETHQGGSQQTGTIFRYRP